MAGPDRQLDRDVEGAARAHQGLLDGLAALTDAEARRPSRLPGWTVGHVLTHLARNADGLRAILEGAAAGRQAPMYPGGADQRNADIEAGAGRTASALVDDVRRASWALEQCWATLPEPAWSGSGLALAGARPAGDVPWMRWREVEVHRADLGLGYGWSDWPAGYVRRELGPLTALWAARRPMGMTALPPAAQRADDRHRLAWLLGRAEIDGVEPAGVMR